MWGECYMFTSTFTVGVIGWLVFRKPMPAGVSFASDQITGDHTTGCQCSQSRVTEKSGENWTSVRESSRNPLFSARLHDLSCIWSVLVQRPFALPSLQNKVSGLTAVVRHNSNTFIIHLPTAHDPLFLAGSHECIHYLHLNLEHLCLPHKKPHTD